MKPTLEQLEPRLCPSADLNALPQLAGLFAQAEALVRSWEAHPLSVAIPADGATPGGYTPAQVLHAYGFDQTVFAGGAPGNGAGQTIAIVDAFDDPNIIGDLQAFDAAFGIPAAPFVIVNQNGGQVRPAADPSGAWELEEALDVEWAHALAPAANIVLVEANSGNLTDLLAGVRTAANFPGVSVVSMSWVNSEQSNETALDSVFTTPAGHQGVTFIAGSGDGGGAVNYPAASPNVLAVGGTTLFLNANSNIASESAWPGSGGGVSQFEPEPTYQRAVQNTGHRTTPDVSFNAGYSVAVYNSYPGQYAAPWLEVGGTSFATPGWAAILAIANQGRARLGEGSLDGPTQTLPAIYAMSAAAFHDIIAGSNGAFSAGPGYDFVTGRGSPIVNLVVAGLGADVMQLSSAANPPSRPAPSASTNNPFINLADLAAIAIEQFDALAYRLLALIDPRDFAGRAVAAQQQLDQHPILPTPQGQEAAAMGRAAFAQALSQ